MHSFVKLHQIKIIDDILRLIFVYNCGLGVRKSPKNNDVSISTHPAELPFSVFFKNIFGNILRNLVTTSFEMRPFLVLSEYSEYTGIQGVPI